MLRIATSTSFKILKIPKFPEYSRIYQISKEVVNLLEISKKCPKAHLVTGILMKLVDLFDILKSPCLKVVSATFLLVCFNV